MITSTYRYTLIKIIPYGKSMLFNLYDAKHKASSGSWHHLSNALNIAPDHLKQLKQNDSLYFSNLQALVDLLRGSSTITIIYEGDSLPTSTTHPEFFI